MAGSPREEIKVKVREAEVLMKSRLVEFFLAGMDEATTEAGVGMALQTEEGEIAHLEVKTIWSGRQGRQMERVGMLKKAAWEVLRRGRIKVGWLMCKAWETTKSFDVSDMGS